VQAQAEGDAYMEDVGGEEEEEREEEDAWIQATKFTYIMILSLLNFKECRQMIIACSSCMQIIFSYII
jgi:hypothetical protein